MVILAAQASLIWTQRIYAQFCINLSGKKNLLLSDLSLISIVKADFLVKLGEALCWVAHLRFKCPTLALFEDQLVRLGLLFLLVFVLDRLDRLGVDDRDTGQLRVER